MSLVIDHPTRGSIKIKTFNSETLEQEKKRASLTKIVAVIRGWIDTVQKGKGSFQLTALETAFINVAKGWCDKAEDLVTSGCAAGELLQVARIGKEVEGFSSLCADTGEALWIELLAVTPPNLTSHSRIGTTLVVSACLEGRRRGYNKLDLISLEPAVGFYQRLDMHDLIDEVGYRKFSLNLWRPLPSKLKEVASKMHAAKRHKKISLQEAEEPSCKRPCNSSTALLEATSTD